MILAKDSQSIVHTQSMCHFVISSQSRNLGGNVCILVEEVHELVLLKDNHFVFRSVRTLFQFLICLLVGHFMCKGGVVLVGD